MSRAAPRRRAEPRPVRWRRSGPGATERGRGRRPRTSEGTVGTALDTAIDTTVGDTRLPVGVWAVAVLSGLALLIAGTVPVGPGILGEIGAVVVATAYTWALAARTGGRPIVFGTLTLVIGLVVLVLDENYLRTGAAVLTSVVTAVLGVMITTPTRRFVEAARECTYAVLVASVGAFAAVAFEPSITLLRFDYVTLALALGGAFAFVYRLGAGLHGLGRRGAATVAIGAVALAVTLVYAELLRRYGATGLVETLLDGVRWSREHLGAFPRPLMTILGIPALAWGCHMRARRRQGWWVCAFGVAATVPVANVLMNPATSLLEAGLSVVYGLLVGLLIGYLVIRADLALTGPRGSRARRAEEALAGRPEPARTSPLL
ncbi:hypothetical protein [Nocardioides ochotonae]|uniref:hypothetical protein n=1 Tax=Nocardioides ochotonae TaxID=2685869 RepID=UPI00140C45FF|nr:hypothetical protein [Nocardioides ochotonae]